MTVQEKEERVVEALGYEGAFNALSKALGEWDLADILDYIIRCYDLEEEQDDDR